MERLEDFGGKITAVFREGGTIFDVKAGNSEKRFYLRKIDLKIERGKAICLTYNPKTFEVGNYSLS